MDIQRELDKRIERWKLLTHPFYQAWEAGELPQEALQDYAGQYGAFIATLPKGWETLGDTETAEEERGHIALWQQFAAALGTKIGSPETEAISGLVAQSQAWFGSPASSLGAMYAFEAQQPATASSKLDGLRRHYRLPEAAEDYFVAHASNQHEAAKIFAQIAALPEGDLPAVLDSCEGMSQAMWDALTDIYDRHCVN